MRKWQILFSWAPKSLQTVTAAMKLKDDCSLEEKLWQCIKKQRQHFSNKGLTVKAIVSPVVMHRCESWTIKKELWCLRRNCGARDSQQLRLPWTARSKQSILKKINPEYSLEGLMPNLKLQYFGHLMWRADSLEKTLMLGKIEGRRRRGQ